MSLEIGPDRAAAPEPAAEPAEPAKTVLDWRSPIYDDEQWRYKHPYGLGSTDDTAPVLMGVAPILIAAYRRVLRLDERPGAPAPGQPDPALENRIAAYQAGALQQQVEAPDGLRHPPSLSDLTPKHFFRWGFWKRLGFVLLVIAALGVLRVGLAILADRAP